MANIDNEFNKRMDSVLELLINVLINQNQMLEWH